MCKQRIIILDDKDGDKKSVSETGSPEEEQIISPGEDTRVRFV